MLIIRGANLEYIIQRKKFTASGKLSVTYIQELNSLFNGVVDTTRIVDYINRVIDQKLTSKELRQTIKPELYPTVESLEDLANEIKVIKKVKIDINKLSPEAQAEVQRKLKEAEDERKKLKKKRKKVRFCLTFCLTWLRLSFESKHE